MRLSGTLALIGVVAVAPGCESRLRERGDMTSASASGSAMAEPPHSAAEASASPTPIAHSGGGVSQQDDVARKLRALRSEHAFEAEAAAVWLIEHRDWAEPALRALVEQGSDGNPRLAFATLARMGSLESVAVLEGIVNTAAEGPAFHAAQALAVHLRVADARAALVRLLKRGGKSARVSAASAIDSWGCTELVAALADPAWEVRALVVDSIKRVSCSARRELERVAQHDPEEVVRAAAAKALRGSEP